MERKYDVMAEIERLRMVRQDCRDRELNLFLAFAAIAWVASVAIGIILT